MRPMRMLTVFAVLMAVAAGCGDDDGGVSVEGAWARSSPMMASAGAAYMNLTAADADRLIGASVDPAIAARVEIHETSMMEGEGDMGGEGEIGGGQMMMQEVGEIALPAGETVSLRPGGLHIMLLQLPQPLTVGQTFDLTLSFENAGDQVIEIEVREDAP